MADVKVPIRAAARLTGMTVDAIRAWERRYSAVEPQRGRGGRLYTEEDIRRLQLLKRAVDHGHSIGQIATLKTDDLESLPIVGRPKPARGVDNRQGDIDQVIEHILAYDMAALEARLGKSATLLPPRRFVYDIALPLLKRVGECWQKGTFTVAQEHMTSAALRGVISAMMRLYQREKAKGHLIFCTPPSQQHEFGIMMAAMLALAGGLSLTYLGTNLPLDDMVILDQKLNPSGLVLGVSQHEGSDPTLAPSLLDLRTKLSSSTDLIIGGSMPAQEAEQLRRSGIVVLPTLESFEARLSRYGARF